MVVLGTKASKRKNGLGGGVPRYIVPRCHVETGEVPGGTSLCVRLSIQANAFAVRVIVASAMKAPASFRSLRRAVS